MELTAEQQVKQVYPDAYVARGISVWIEHQVQTSFFNQFYGRLVFGTKYISLSEPFDTEAAAWENALLTIKK